jgi:hypothetical protein
MGERVNVPITKGITGRLRKIGEFWTKAVVIAGVCGVTVSCVGLVGCASTEDGEIPHLRIEEIIDCCTPGIPARHFVFLSNGGYDGELTGVTTDEDLPEWFRRDPNVVDSLTDRCMSWNFTDRMAVYGLLIAMDKGVLMEDADTKTHVIALYRQGLWEIAPDVRYNLLWELCGKPEITLLVLDDVVSVLRESSSDREKRLAMIAIGVLGDRGQKAIPAIREQLTSGNHQNVSLAEEVLNAIEIGQPLVP